MVLAIRERLRLPSVGVALGAMLLPAVALACPRCAAGRRAWHDVLTDHFMLNVCIAALPFAIIALACAATEALGARATQAARSAGGDK